MAGLNRFVEILRLFDEHKANWTIPEIAVATDVPASTVYRTVRELVAQGFLDPSIEAHYRLGAAFIEFDRRLRLTDPLIREGEAMLADLVVSAQVPCVAVLARLYRDQVICVAEHRAGGRAVETSYEKGRPMPLLRGATSKVVLAQLPKAKLGKVVKAAGHDRLLRDDMVAELATIRRQGYAITRGEVDSGLIGIAAPVSCPETAINASMSIIIRASDSNETIERRLLMALSPVADLLSRKLRQVLAPSES
ncbi:helix-turn-helix domain-containing protein [Rhizobium pusense]|uniref:IclR family transcriptional regulator n=1 Tax=Agrobacterium pusense TaxID=648995 RepID=UPI001FCDA7E2|nr:IclR family transcriptional regulator C-terminal domain-containing protein [Agrobacterium pusense]MCJ2877417.1 helix-turn-helix domain-containing protein [Agrobacterium pusense]